MGVCLYVYMLKPTKVPGTWEQSQDAGLVTAKSQTINLHLWLVNLHLLLTYHPLRNNAHVCTQKTENPSSRWYDHREFR